MGWTSLHRAPGTSDRQWVTDNLLLKGMEIVACATKRGVFYAAVRNGRDVVPSGYTWALVVLMQRNPRSHYNFTYKDMDETMGPSYYDAPAAVLDALSPTDSEWANQWRETCRKALERRASLPAVKRGDVVRFAHPLTFRNGRTLSELTFVERTTFKADTFMCKVPNWRRMAYTVVQPD